MIVQAIAIQRAIAMRHRACLNIMKNNNAMLSMCRMPFRGANPEDLVQKETALECSNAQNDLVYKMAEKQEEQAKEQLKEENKHKLDVTA